MKPIPDYHKLRGGYYTPADIARFLARWAVLANTDNVLEPSAGDGNILVAAAERLLDLGLDPTSVHNQLHGVELDPNEATKANTRIAEVTKVEGVSVVTNRDFFSHAQERLFLALDEGVEPTTIRSFDAVIGNPPFIRYQNFPEDHRKVAFQLMGERGFSPNRLTNIWLPFLVLSAHLVRDNGRLAMVVPAELFQVGYAAEARRFLSTFFENITIVTFKSLLFPGVQQEVVLLLAEKSSTNSAGIRTVELEDARDLVDFEPSDIALTPVKPIDHTTEKWTKYFLDAREIELLRKTRNVDGVVASGEVLDVNVGVVTGNNKYFLLTEEEVSAHSLHEHVLPVVTRSQHLLGAAYSTQDHCENVIRQLPTSLFAPDEVDFEIQPPQVQSYIQLGEVNKQHTGYKCRIRKRWFIVPSLAVPDAFMLRQVHGFPKLVLNESGATCTDTIHRVNFLGAYPREAVVAAFLNSLTFAHSEIKGRSYGGGVLTFEPSEAEDLPLPLRNAHLLDFQQIDRLLRNGKIDEVLDITDQVLLVDGLGLEPSEVACLRGIWQKLRDRRLNRR